MGASPIVAPDRRLSGRASIVGVGEADYGADYRAARAKAPGYEAPTIEGLATTAFERALADAALARGEIDGVSVSYLHGGPSAAETATMLGLSPRWAKENGGIMAGPLPGTIPMPYGAILVELDEGPLFVSNPLDRTADIDALYGRRVRVAFVDAIDDAGPFRLPVFAPA